MNKILDDYRKEFLEENGLYEKVFLSDEEQEKIKKQLDEGLREDEENPFHKYYYEIVDSSYGNNTYKFYEKKPIQITDSELSQYISLEMLNLTAEMNRKQTTMKNIMIFWVIITIISLIGSLYTAIKIG